MVLTDQLIQIRETPHGGQLSNWGFIRTLRGNGISMPDWVSTISHSKPLLAKFGVRKSTTGRIFLDKAPAFYTEGREATWRATNEISSR
jgi:hypothetical protein